MAENETVTYDGVSVFHSLGLPNADDLQLRSERLQAITKVILERELKPREAGDLMGMDRPQINALMKGRISEFPADRLLRALRDLG